MAYKLSKEEITKEILKCGKNPAYFLDNYAKIVHQSRGLIPFHTFKFQKQLLDDFHDHRYNIILKSRQMGISTIVAGYSAWMMLFHKERNILVMATKLNTAIEIVEKVKDIIDSVPDWIKIADIAVNNKTKLELTNGSKIHGVPTSKDAGRSQALSLLILDEAAHVEDMDDLWTGLLPTISTGGRCIALSTPNGVGNWFHKTYVDSESGNNNFKPTKLPWHLHPEYDQDWFDNITRNMSRRQIAQEFECNFNASGETVMNADDITRIKKDICEPKYRTWMDRNYHIWKEYQPDGSYLLSADVARGDGKDFSVFHILDIKNMEQVAEYQGKIDLDNFARLLFDAGREYGNCMVVVENNNVGFAVLTKLVEMRYPNLYYSAKGSQDFVDSLHAQYSSNTVPGFTTTMKTRPLIVAKLEEFIRNKSIKINSQRAIHELDTFVWVNGRPEAQKGYNDDLVMSLAIGCWVRDTAIINNERNLEYSKAFLSAITKEGNYLNTSIRQFQNEDKARKQQQAIKTYVDHSWIIKG
jgi:phage FluMu gp28-like protein